MPYKKLYIQIIIRVLLIVFNALLLGYVFFLDKYPASQINLLVLLIFQTILLIYYLNKTNRELAHFFSSVTNEDSTVVFNQDDGKKSYTNLHNQLNKINKLIEQIRIEKSGHYEYLKHVVENIGVGIISYDSNQKVDLFNSAGKEILGITKLNSISELDKSFEGFSNTIKILGKNTQHLLHLKNNSIDIELSLKQIEFTIHKKKMYVLAFQNILSELNNREVESWQKVIRVLTHEIMNSVSPITSATSAINNLYETENDIIKPKEITEEIIMKTVKGLNIIQKRSTGMVHFVQKFRDLSLIPEPTYSKFSIKDLILNIETLFSKELNQKNIEFNVKVTPDMLELNADSSQIEQVLINLAKNAIESLENTKNPRITFKAYRNIQEKVIIEVSDNGKGIESEIISEIFTPFFTTKENPNDGNTGGSGIGLSLSRQVMQLHNGSISVQSEPNVNTVFTLTF